MMLYKVFSWHFTGDNEVTSKAKDQLQYLHAALYESMRISTAVPIGVPHETRCDTTIGTDFLNDTIQ